MGRYGADGVVVSLADKAEARGKCDGCGASLKRKNPQSIDFSHGKKTAVICADCVDDLVQLLAD